MQQGFGVAGTASAALLSGLACQMAGKWIIWTELGQSQAE
jgi:hypothetical protein